ncbi:Pimeloyl-ACP methyl ester carboxylesterase [Micromonospora citrea]|uniref:Pimeloyl-ACP methyl ester carboxylesterase n=1 Tax=Micromonospora citrea TaxID=47855 RepID=A0A1C6VXM3_9ACTN|nr:alpha/beta hydrolase [Micromonospora citrea]SCL70874.1 Pimeloyl-ACP methyl ester carboxylesterase [Micromonospora citrea]
MTTKTGATEVAGVPEAYANQGDGGRQPERSETAVRHFTIHHDGVTIPVSRGGRGRPLVLCPGLNSTQADLHELIGLLRSDHDVITFDLRGHGFASAADRYSFEAFRSDLAAVMAELERLDLPSAPVLVGYSLGADLALHHACEHPGSVAGLVLIDGANPVPEPFVTDADRAEFLALWEGLAIQHETLRGTERQVLLTAQETLDLNIEIDAVRSGILDLHRKVVGPVSMVMSMSMAGDSGGEHAPRLNRNWRAGVERLVRERPQTATFWLAADHGLVFTHAPEIAQIIRGAQGAAGQAACANPPRRGDRQDADHR